MRTRTKEKSLQVLETELDLVFGQFIAFRDYKDGWSCFICGKSISSKGNGEVGHWIKRQHIGTRYHEENCHFICLDCNRFDEQHEIKYEQRLIEVYGIDKVTELMMFKRSLMKPMRSDISQTIEHYKVKISELRKQKHL
jgi:hypothetical protein